MLGFRLANSRRAMLLRLKAKSKGTAMSERTFVLVHGAWCYRKVSQRLRSYGHQVFTPTLTGLGERSHLSGWPINLSTHIQDVVTVIAWEDLSDVILCGHSYGGMVVTGVADQLAERISTLVYLDAFVPDESGVSLNSMLGPDALVPSLGGVEVDGLSVPAIPAAVFNVNEADRAWVDAKCVRQPVATMMEGIRLDRCDASIADRHYVLATGWGSPAGPTPFHRLHERFAQDPTWQTHCMSGGHDLMVDSPEEVAQLLMDCADRKLGVANKSSHPPHAQGGRSIPDATVGVFDP